MSTRVTAFSAAPGELSDYSTLNAIMVSIAAMSATIGYDNLADEGVDVRNIEASSLVECTVSNNYIERTTVTAAAAGGDFNNESTTPLSMGGNVELDWTAQPLVMDADTVLVVVAELAIGAPSSALGVPDSTNIAGAAGGTMGGCSAVIATKLNGAAYSIRSESRSSAGGKAKVTGVGTGIISQRQTLTCIYVIQGGTASVESIALCFGSLGTTNYRLYAAQLRAIAFHRTTY